MVLHGLIPQKYSEINKSNLSRVFLTEQSRALRTAINAPNKWKSTNHSTRAFPFYGLKNHAIYCCFNK